MDKESQYLNDLYDDYILTAIKSPSRAKKAWRVYEDAVAKSMPNRVMREIVWDEHKNHQNLRKAIVRKASGLLVFVEKVV